MCFAVSGLRNFGCSLWVALVWHSWWLCFYFNLLLLHTTWTSFIWCIWLFLEEDGCGERTSFLRPGTVVSLRGEHAICTTAIEVNFLLKACNCQAGLARRQLDCNRPIILFSILMVIEVRVWIETENQVRFALRNSDVFVGKLRRQCRIQSLCYFFRD